LEMDPKEKKKKLAPNRLTLVGHYLITIDSPLNNCNCTIVYVSFIGYILLTKSLPCKCVAITGIR